MGTDEAARRESRRHRRRLLSRGAFLEAISERLGEEGYAPLPAADASTASRLCRFTGPDLLIVDLALPDGTAEALLREGTRHPDFPDVGVLALAGRGNSIAMLRDPEPALDDYLRRPFDLDELSARVHGILRRRHGGEERVVRLGGLVIEPPRHKVTVGGAEVHLARKSSSCCGCRRATRPASSGRTSS